VNVELTVVVACISDEVSDLPVDLERSVRDLDRKCGVEPDLLVVLLGGHEVGGDLGLLDARLGGVGDIVAEEVPGGTGGGGSTKAEVEGGRRLGLGRRGRGRELAAAVEGGAEGGAGSAEGALAGDTERGAEGVERHCGREN